MIDHSPLLPGQWPYDEAKLRRLPGQAMSDARAHRNCTPGNGCTSDSCGAKAQVIRVHDEMAWTWPIPNATAGQGVTRG